MYPGLRYTQKIKFASKLFCKTCLFEYKNQFALRKKNKKIFGAISNILFFLLVRYKKFMPKQEKIMFRSYFTKKSYFSVAFMDLLNISYAYGIQKMAPMQLQCKSGTFCILLLLHGRKHIQFVKLEAPIRKIL